MRVVAALLIAVLVSGCDGLAAPSQAAPSQAAPSQAAPTHDPFALAPAAVRDRVPLPACGTEEATANLPARQCFWDAYTAGRTAEFITTRPTRSGDRFTTLYRSLGGGRAQLFHNALVGTGGGWLQVDCQGLTLTRDGPFFPDFIPGLPGGPACVETPLGRGA
jgi:hypothetical protein